MSDSNQKSTEMERLSYIESVLKNYVGKLVNIKHAKVPGWRKAVYVGKETYCNNRVGVFIWKEPTEENLEQIVGYRPIIDKEFKIDEQEEGLYITFLSHCYWSGIKENTTMEEDRELFDRYNLTLLGKSENNIY